MNQIIAQFKAKIIESENGIKIKAPQIKPSHITNKGSLGNMAHLKVNKELNKHRDSLGYVNLPCQDIVCIDGGFISTFEIRV